MKKELWQKRHKRLMKLLRDILPLQHVTRYMRITGDPLDRSETVIGHVELLRVTGRAVIRDWRLPISLGKWNDLVEVHDLPEAWTARNGRDLCSFVCTQKECDEKHAEELKKLKAFCRRHPHLSDYLGLYREVRELKTPASRFLHAIEPILSALCILMGNRTTKEMGITMEAWIADRGGKIKTYPAIQEYAETIIFPAFRRRKGELFWKPPSSPALE